MNKPKFTVLSSPIQYNSQSVKQTEYEIMNSHNYKCIT